MVGSLRTCCLVSRRLGRIYIMFRQHKHQISNTAQRVNILCTHACSRVPPLVCTLHMGVLSVESGLSSISCICPGLHQSTTVCDLMANSQQGSPLLLLSQYFLYWVSEPLDKYIQSVFNTADALVVVTV